MNFLSLKFTVETISKILTFCFSQIISKCFQFFFPKPICVSGYSMNRRLPNDYLLPSGGFPGSAGASGGHIYIIVVIPPAARTIILQDLLRERGFPGPGISKYTIILQDLLREKENVKFYKVPRAREYTIILQDLLRGAPPGCASQCNSIGFVL